MSIPLLPLNDRSPYFHPPLPRSGDDAKALVSPTLFTSHNAGLGSVEAQRSSEMAPPSAEPVTAATTPARREAKQLPAPNSDFYQLGDLLTAEKKAIVKMVRTCMESRVQSNEQARE